MDSVSALSWRARCGVALMLVCSVMVAACGSSSKKSSGSNAGSASSGSIRISKFTYVPASLKVKAGSKVAIVNGDPDQHTVTADGGAFDSGTLQPKGSGSLTLTQTGTFPFHCSFHPFMHGTVTVR